MREIPIGPDQRLDRACSSGRGDSASRYAEPTCPQGDFPCGPLAYVATRFGGTSPSIAMGARARRLGHRTALLAAFAGSIIAVGCGGSTSVTALNIDFESQQVREQTAFLTLTVLADACASSEAPLYRSHFSASGAEESPPRLDGGRFAFGVSARNANCQLVGFVCSEFDLPLAGDTDLLLRVGSAGDAGQVCPACLDVRGCTPGQGPTPAEGCDRGEDDRPVACMPSCDACGEGTACSSARDCASGRCKSGVCAAAAAVQYRFNEGAGTTVFDSGSAALNLNLTADRLEPSTPWSQEGFEVGRGRLRSQEASQLRARLLDSEALSIELWVTPSRRDFDSDARVLVLDSLRDDEPNHIAVGVIQGATSDALKRDYFSVRLRTEETNVFGQPALFASNSIDEVRKTHIVFTRFSDGREYVYIDGQQAAAGNRPGALSNWFNQPIIALGNTTEGLQNSSRDRQWSGRYHYAAIYDEPLSSEEVADRFEGGPLH